MTSSSSASTASRFKRSHSPRRHPLPRRLAAALVAVTAGLASAAGTASADIGDSTTGKEGDTTSKQVLYELRNVYSGLMAESPGLESVSGALMVQSIATGGSNQRWYLKAVQYDYRTLYTIRNQASGMCLAPALTKLTSNVQQVACALTVSQYWHLNTDGTSYAITNWKTRTRLAVSDAKAGSALILKAPDTTKSLTPSTLERWQLTSFLIAK